MASIRTAIQLVDNFSDPFSNIVNSVNAGLSTMDRLDATLNRPIDTSSMNAVQAQIDEVTEAAQRLNAALSVPPSVPIGQPETNVQAVNVPVTPSVGEVPQINVPEEITIPVTPVITEQPQVDVPEVDVPVNPVISEKPVINVPEGLDIPITPVVTEQPQIDIPDGAEVPITPIITEQPVIETPDDVIIPVTPSVGEVPQINVPEEITIPVDVETPEMNMSGLQEQIEAVSSMLGKITAVQDSINTRANGIEILPKDTQYKLSVVNTKIQEINAALSYLENNPFNMPTEAVRLQIVELNNSILETANAQKQLNTELEGLSMPELPQPPPLEIPVKWITDNFEVFTSTGIERYQQELGNLTTILQEVDMQQAQITQQAGSLQILPPQATTDIQNLQGRLNELQGMIQQIETNALAINTDEANAQLERLRGQMLQVQTNQQNLQQAMQGTDVSAINSAYMSLSRTISSTEQSVRSVRDSMQEPVEIPVQWQSDNLEVFTNTGVERFQSEIQSTNAMLNTLNDTQNRIAQTAGNVNLFPANMVADLSGMQNRLQAIQSRIEQIENNPLNLGADAANAELEQLRAQLDQAVSAQQTLDDALSGMDVSSANDAYLRLSSTVANTERYIRDNVSEQGVFNAVISQGADEANRFQGMIAKAFGAFAGIAGIRKVFSFVQDCTKAFNTQLNAETQLISVLANMLDADYVAQFEVETVADTSGAIGEINAIQSSVNAVEIPVSAETKALTAAFDQITEKASEIQSRGIYGDEIMIAAAAEFSTYFTDTDAITMMMDTLTDYAMGMSGGGELDSTAMVDYATNLGKIMSGAYDAMTKKGFELTDAQKAIIEGTATQEQIVATLGEEYVNMSSDMQAAAAISQVIEESWAGLYESMSNTPEGKIIQLTNAWGDMKEVVGGQLYPYVLLFVDAITENWSTIEGAISVITTGLEYMLGVLSWLMEGAINFAQVVADNWSWISPIIYGIAGALAVYGSYLAITKGIELASAAVKGIMAVAEGIHAAAIWATTSATWAEVTAQNGLNAAMYACPIVWIIVLIIALIALFYAAVAAVNHFAGTSVSATGIICGVFTVAAAFIGNLFVTLINFVIDIFVVLWNFIAAFANFFGNAFNDPVGAIARLFFDLVDTILSLLQTLASAIDTIFGSNLASSVQGWRDSLSGWVDETFGQGEEIMAQLNAEDLHLGRFEYGSAWDAGYSFGEGIDESIANFDPSTLFGTTDIPTAEDYASALADSAVMGDIGSGVDDIAGNTGSIADSLDITDEDLKYLRDIAEQEAINRYTTAEIKVDMSGMQNIVQGSNDLDGIVTYLTDAVNEAVESLAEGVHE